MLVYGTQLVVLPFRKDTLADEQEGGVGEGYACRPQYSLLKNLLMFTCRFLGGLKLNLGFVGTKKKSPPVSILT